MLRYFPGKLATISLGITFLVMGRADAQPTFAGNAQHTGLYTPTAQSLNAIHWTAPIDLNNTGGYAHYGAPVLTPAQHDFRAGEDGRNGRV